ncbi:chloride channel protein [Niabella sp. CC-SYL272]|uniref:chloride channel protein n=1 Tax=Niabella agricola TaxID=2891571 RepID=UPI001F411640|nr:chloride channel protein [Niabella agricola]MCF3109127.1 chloride channel protein [Niabella agricola]
MSIPISTSLQSTLASEQMEQRPSSKKIRLVFISLLAIGIGALVSLVAKLLISLINLVTNLAFFGTFSAADASPGEHHLGMWVMVIPVIGGIMVGFMALYGSRAIRGHGIPEAMEQILTNNSKIKPTITYLKPLSAAIAIGTGGPFGAEGPIIATGGALGSTLGQLLKISHQERKVLLAAGATAGMSAIFGSPIAAIFLAIELLLFEFSAASILPVALACITGAAGHHFLFSSEPVFAITQTIATPSNPALFLYSIEGVLIGLLAVVVTKAVYGLEALFERLPIHWMWWPAIGGLAVGIIGYFYPNTLGVGYNNITDVLSGSPPLKMIALLFLFKFLSWAIALSSGTSGGTLAPLLTIGGAAGALTGMALHYFFPQLDVSVSLAALIGMSAMFAGASRALLTSILFALETTGQVHALLALLAACALAYFISFYLMEHTIMTEKIARRGVRTPVNYTPDVLEQYQVKDVMSNEALLINNDNQIADVRRWLDQHPDARASYFIIAGSDHQLRGVVSSSSLQSEHQDPTARVDTLIKRKSVWVRENGSLKTAVEIMLRFNVDLLPVTNKDQVVIGSINYKNIMTAYQHVRNASEQKQVHISLKRQTLKLLIKGNRLVRRNPGQPRNQEKV